MLRRDRCRSPSSKDALWLDLPRSVSYIWPTLILEGLRYARRIQEIHLAWKRCGYGGRRLDWGGIRRGGGGADKKFSLSLYLAYGGRGRKNINAPDLPPPRG